MSETDGLEVLLVGKVLLLVDNSNVIISERMKYKEKTARFNFSAF